MKNHVLLFLFFMAAVELSAQCPVVTCPATLTIPCSTTGLGQPVTATSNYSANITSQWYYSSALPLSPDIPLWSIGTSNSSVYLNHPGFYFVEFTDNASGCVTTQSITVTGSPNAPTFMVTSPAPYLFTQGCQSSGTIIHIVDQNTNPLSGGTLTFALNTDKNNPPNWVSTIDYTLTNCGEVVAMVKDVNNGCISSFDVKIICPQTISVSISGPPGNTVCAGSTAIISATSNAMFNYWDSGEDTLNIVVTAPPSPDVITYSLTAANPNGWNCGVTEVYTLTVLDCTQTPSTTVGIADNQLLSNNINLFPNPASSQLTMKTNLSGEISFTVYDIIGKEITKGVFTNSKTINISAFDNGTYLLKLQSGQQSLYKKVIIKN